MKHFNYLYVESVIKKAISGEIDTSKIASRLGVSRQYANRLITTSVSQAKGRIERLWETLQSRLITELRLRGITTISEANAFLPAFMDGFNEAFAAKPDMGRSLFAPAPSAEETDFYLSIEHQRVADNGSCVKFKNAKMAFFDKDGSIVMVAPKATIDIYETLSGRLVGAWSGDIYDLCETPKTEREKPKAKEELRKWVPPKNHPWRNYCISPKKKVKTSNLIVTHDAFRYDYAYERAFRENDFARDEPHQGQEYRH